MVRQHGRAASTGGLPARASGNGPLPDSAAKIKGFVEAVRRTAAMQLSA
jgi:hypothetical protein